MDTIFALATAQGRAGVAVIRISGPDAATASARLMSTVPAKRGLRKLTDTEGALIDEALVLRFDAGKSFTGEDVIELQLHGSPAVVAAMLRLLGDDWALRPAEPGEFTQRAFLNGKLDLDQAEAVADLIHAKSIKAVDAAHQQLEGRLGEHIKTFRQQIIDATAMVELELDFIEEDVEFANKEQLRKLLTELDLEIGRLLDTYETGRLVKDGVKTVFIGKPNAGKSTLLNTLVGTERAIVTEIAGTTRDTIDADWSYEGLLFKLIDTAGLRDTEDRIEAEGVKRSQKAFEQADLVVYLKDLILPLTTEEREEIAQFQKRAADTPFLLIGTKLDLEKQKDDERLQYDLKISALEEQNIDQLKKLMKQRALENKDYDTSSLLVTSSRHRDGLQKARENVQRAINALDQGLTGDFLSIDLRAALKELGTITGEITTEDLLDSIFSRFCIGK